jgi:hypothetical protein
MRFSFSSWRRALAAAHLDHEEELYRTLEHCSFKKTKDWDDKGQTVTWEGTIAHPDLERSYRIAIHYDDRYPFVRPNVYPIDPPIINQRHQYPSERRGKAPGALCLFPHTPDLWSVGLGCDVIIERVVSWLKAYEEGGLDYEFAPPEIERFFPDQQRLDKPALLLLETLLDNTNKTQGECLLLPTSPGEFGILTCHDMDFTIQSEALSSIIPNSILISDKPVKGRWFALECEPLLPVPLNLAELMRLLVRAGRPLKAVSELATDDIELVALRYPTTFGMHWLVFATYFTVPRGNRGSFRKKNLHYRILQANSAKSVWLYQTYYISKDTIFRRVAGFDVEVLLEKKCLILGCGSIGSRVAENLIKTGVGHLILLDKDVMRAGNVTRHVLGLDSISKKKAVALREHLLRKNVFAKVESVVYDPLTQPENFEQLVFSVDLVISCLGSDGTEVFVNAVCKSAGKPVIFCRSHLQSRIGAILISMEGRGCFECLSKHLTGPECPIPRLPEIAYKDLVGLDADCGSAFLPASAIDLDHVALHCSRLILAMLQGQDLKNNYWLVRGREFEVGEFPSLSGPVREPFRQFEYEISTAAECTVCKAA